jgi:imidazolonepropionase-like amidohydrolase
MIGPLQDKFIPADNGAEVLLEGGTLIDGIGDHPRPGSSVLILDDIVQAVGPAPAVAAQASSRARRVDCSGLFILPGLIDLHVHYLGQPNARVHDAKIAPVPGLRVLRAARDLYRTLEGGFTTVRDLGHGNPDRIQGLKEAIDAGDILGPRIITSRWAISQTAGHGHFRSWPYEWVARERPRSTFADGVDGCLKAVRRNFGEGADLIKIYLTEGSRHLPNFTLEEIRTMTDEAHRRGAKVAAHAKSIAGVRNAVLGGVDTVEHGTMEPVPELFDLMAEHNVILVPTYGVLFWLAEEGTQWGATPERVARAQRLVEKIPGALVEARARGVKIGFGTDTGHGGGPGVAKNAKGLELLVQAGLRPEDALRAATGVAAEALGKEDGLGAVEKGKVADLIIVNTDPLEDIISLQNRDNIAWLMKSRMPLS